MDDMTVSTQDKKFRSTLPAGLKLTATLRYMATGDTYMSIAYDFRVASESICHFIPEVWHAITDTYKEDVLSCSLTVEGLKDGLK